MKKYRGMYRVICEFSRNSLEPIKDDLFIYCSNGGQIYRINNETLAYYREDGVVTSRLLSKLNEAGVHYRNESHGEVLIYFKESDINKVVDVFAIRTSGANYAPNSIKNLKLFKWFRDNEEWYRSQGLTRKAVARELTNEEKDVMRERLKFYRENKRQGMKV